MPSPNLLAGLPETPLAEEMCTDILNRPGLRLERIVSTGQSSPPGFWYDQPHGEWVLLLTGRAGVQFEDEDGVRLLEAGDQLDIAPHRRHRVAWTSATPATVWLALHYAVA